MWTKINDIQNNNIVTKVSNNNPTSQLVQIKCIKDYFEIANKSQSRRSALPLESRGRSVKYYVLM